ncbi:MAG TPA: hypothetical protein PLY16_01155 [Candidatus Saccharibacteria bacterium]|nr:hypothetical protein [Candidatus Saccharibacteria bacterium]
MSYVEIQYNISDFSKNEPDFERVVAAVGAYQQQVEKADFRIQQTAEIEQFEDNVQIKLVRHTLHTLEEDVALGLAEQMREGVGQFFLDQERERLDSHFSGIALRHSER